MKAADRASRRPAAADRNAEALLWRRGAGACTRQIDLFCAPQLMSTGPAVRAGGYTRERPSPSVMLRDGMSSHGQVRRPSYGRVSAEGHATTNITAPS